MSHPLKQYGEQELREAEHEMGFETGFITQSVD